jgi:hypothetical protein
MAHWPDLQYCRTDLIAAKGVVFCKFSKSSSALRALESSAGRSMVCPGLLWVSLPQLLMPMDRTYHITVHWKPDH